VLVAGAVLLVLVALPSPVLDPVATRLTGAQLDGCVDIDGLDVDVGAWPAVARSVLGGLRGVAVRAERVRVGGVTARDVTARFDRLSAAGLPGDRVEVGGGTVHVALTDRDLRGVLPSPARVRIRPDGVALGVPVLGLAAPVMVDVVVETGDLVLRPRLVGVALATAVRITPPAPFRLHDVRLATGRLELSATADGEIDLRRFGC